MSYTITFYSEQNKIGKSVLNSQKCQLTIGRNPTNDVVLPYGVISGNHAVIELISNKLYIKDNKSTNGTFVDHKLIQPGIQVLISNE